MTLPVYKIDYSVPLRNADYYGYLWERISQATQRIWVSVFIVNASTAGDTELRVRELLKHLAYAKWRNVDVKVLLGQSMIGALQIQNRAVERLLGDMGIEARNFQSNKDVSTHSKYVIIDQAHVMVGSNNWSPGGLGGNIEDTLAVRSVGLNTTLAANFINHWNEAQDKEKI